MHHHLGYYRCNGIDFDSKINALLYSATVNQPVQWMFHQDIFGQHPWHIEPEQSLDQLYDARARQLREQYDYVILSFSGGADTNNILECFVRQGLHIDEIVINHMGKATAKTTVLDPKIKHSWNFAAEHQLQAVPRLQYIKKHLPQTKITELDVSDSVINALSAFDDVDWVLHRNDHLSVGQLFRYNYFHFGEIKKQFDAGKKVCIIVGIDKPKTFIRDNKFYLGFIDTVTNITTINDFNKDYHNVTTELFYWSPECAPLLSKQAHTIKNWIQQRPERKKFWINPSYSTVRLYHERWLRNLIYTTWDAQWFQADKSTNWWNTEFDTWFRTNSDMKSAYQLWQHGIGYLASKLPDFVQYNQAGQADKLQSFRHEYLIADLPSM
jgi:hypothetical protein